MTYRVFTRNWYKMSRGQLAPDTAARKRTLSFVDSEEEARNMCKEYNSSHEPGYLSHKAEYTKV